jgi:microcompartment protein CcmL/EutN
MLMAQITHLGILELSSIATGYAAQDALLKTAPVEIIIARSICSGKFLIAVSGTLSAITAAVEAGATAANGSLIEHQIIGNLHPQVFPALGLSVSLDPMPGALGVVETFSAASAVQAADAIAKNAEVLLFRIQLAMALGGKGLVLFGGNIGEADAGMKAGVAALAELGMLAGSALIPAPSKELIREFI